MAGRGAGKPGPRGAVDCASFRGTGRHRDRRLFLRSRRGWKREDNIDAWSGTITAPDGSNAPSAPQKRTIAGHAVTEVLFTGTYAQASLQPALPPAPKPGYALLGAVVECPGGDVYWRVTGPAGQVLALAPILDKVLDSLKPHAPAPAPKP